MLDIIFQQIENVWKVSGAWPDFISAMRQGLVKGEKNGYPEQESTKWAFLPIVCCQAAGGDSAWAVHLAAAWLLFYQAADIMDSLEDRDKLVPYLEALGPGVTLNIASGLFFTASLALNGLHRQATTREAAAEVIEDFHKGFLEMCAGQHRDLVYKQPTLHEWFQIAAAKSGSFFALACRSGARLATSDPDRLEAFSSFGSHLGVLIQILDDLEEFQGLQDTPVSVLSKDIHRSLPAVYASEVLPEDSRSQLINRIEAARENPEAVGDVIQLLNGSGAALYLRAQIERRRGQAKSALDAAHPERSAGENLLRFLNSLVATDSHLN